MISLEEARKILDPESKKDLTDEYIKSVHDHIIVLINTIFDNLEIEDSPNLLPKSLEE